MCERRKHRKAAAEAIRSLQHGVRWRMNKDTHHLAKRKAMGHLPGQATVGDYNALIGDVLAGSDNLVYRYPFSGKDYYGVSGEVKGIVWLVIFGADGIMETAFPPDDPSDYLTKHGFLLLSPIEETLYE